MLFSSLTFLTFLLFIYLIWLSIKQAKIKLVLLIVASSYFIVTFGLVSIITILFVSLISYFAGIGMEKSKNYKNDAIFVFSLLLIVGNLIFFKYYNFVIDNFGLLLKIFDVKNPFPTHSLVQPIGVSFYTFSVLSYIIDIKTGRILPERRILNFLNYVLFFPKLIAGPIERPSSFLLQENVIDKCVFDNLKNGFKLIVWGFFQKLVIADRISIYVDTIYSNTEMHSGFTIGITLILYTFQIYADFSGYTDISRGIARLFGYDLMKNFERPLLASSVTQFWRRWHISLSSWVNDYIYTPLSLKFRTHGLYGIIFSLFISFLIIGIWHGANWTFVFFGFIQGTILTIEMFYRRGKFFKMTHANQKFVFIGIIYNFVIISLSLVFFRANTISESLFILSSLFSTGDFFLGDIWIFLYSIFGIAVLLIREILIEFFKRDILVFSSKYFLVRALPYAILIILILLIGVFDGGQFIYFQY
jgi:alginate O-acetyltransferase complex protein AlgI